MASKEWNDVRTDTELTPDETESCAEAIGGSEEPASGEFASVTMYLNETGEGLRFQCRKRSGITNASLCVALLQLVQNLMMRGENDENVDG